MKKHLHRHTHAHNPSDLSGKKLLFATLLNLFISVVQVIGGTISNSLSLISDALHNLGDGTAIMLAYFANRISQKEFTDKRTFGFKRLEILTALFNAIVLIVVSVHLFIEAINRISHPEPIKGLIMFSIATAGLLANLLAVLILKKDARSNINIKAAYLHLLGDTLSSVAVITGGALIYFYEIYLIDPVVTIIIGLYIIWHACSIVKETIDILMQATPRGLDLHKLKITAEQIPEIENIHHAHAWNLTDKKIHFECHIDLKEDIQVSRTEQIQLQLEQLLREQFNIDHVTIQYEFNCCSNKQMVYKNYNGYVSG